MFIYLVYPVRGDIKVICCLVTECDMPVLRLRNLPILTDVGWIATLRIYVIRLVLTIVRRNGLATKQKYTWICNVPWGSRVCL